MMAVRQIYKLHVYILCGDIRAVEYEYVKLVMSNLWSRC